jgi:putative transposase
MAKPSRYPNARRVYEFIKAHRREYPVELMCRILDVAQSGYYEWLQKPVSDRALEDARRLAPIRASYKASHGIYGARRDFLDLGEAGETCSKNRVERLMRINKIVALHGYRTRHYAYGSHREARRWRGCWLVDHRAGNIAHEVNPPSSPLYPAEK